MAVSESVDAFVESLPDDLKSSPMAELARILADRLDNCGARETTALSKELREALAQLQKAAPAKKEGSKRDELKARRAARMAGTANPSRPAAGEQRGPGSD